MKFMSLHYWLVVASALCAIVALANQVDEARLISTVEPIFTIVAAGYLFKESLTAIQLVGGALILGAVLVAEWGAIRSASPRRSPARKRTR